MGDILQEFCNSRGVSVQIDREAGVIRGVKVLGLESRNGRTYLPEALAAAASLYEEAKVNVNHPKGNPTSPRDYQDRIGVIRQVTLRDGQGLFADFHFNPKHTLAEQLLWDAEHAPENVGFSHNVEARVARRGEQLVVEEITRVQSVDLVADPATSRGLFESMPSLSTAQSDDAAQSSSIKSQVASASDSAQSDGSIVEHRDEEVLTLRREVERLQAMEHATQRRETAYRLIREAGLPNPSSQEPWDRLICGELFVEWLLAAEDEAAMRRLVNERAKLVRALRCQGVRPVAIDQHQAAALDGGNQKSFVETIT